MPKTPDLLRRAAETAANDGIRERHRNDVRDRAAKLIIERGENDPREGGNPTYWEYEASVDVETGKQDPVAIRVIFKAWGLQSDGTFEEFPNEGGLTIDIPGSESIDLRKTRGAIDRKKILFHSETLEQWQQVLETIEAQEHTPVDVPALRSIATK